MTTREKKLRIAPALPIDLYPRALRYARRMRISVDDLLELALEEFVTSNLEQWRRTLSTVVELAALNYLGSVDRLMTDVEVSHEKEKAEAKVPTNRWRLPPHLHARCVAAANHLGLTCDEFFEVALRSCVANRLIPPSMREALASLGAMALNDYLEKRQPSPGPRADRTAVARLRH